MLKRCELRSAKAANKAVDRRRSIIGRAARRNTDDGDDDGDVTDGDDDEADMFFCQKKQTRRTAFISQHRETHLPTVLSCWDSETQQSANTSDVKERHVMCKRRLHCREKTCTKARADCSCAESTPDGKFVGRLLCVCSKCDRPWEHFGAQNKDGSPRYCECTTKLPGCESHAEHTQERDDQAMYEIFQLKHPEAAKARSTRMVSQLHARSNLKRCRSCPQECGKTTFLALRPWYVKRPHRRTCVCTYHKKAKNAIEDQRKAHAELHSNCGTDTGCRCDWCKGGKCKQEGKDLFSSFYRAQVILSLCSIATLAHDTAPFFFW